MRYFATALVGFSLLFPSGFASAQVRTSKVFLLEHAGNSQWCSYTTESTWKANVQEVGAMKVGTLAYSNDHQPLPPPPVPGNTEWERFDNAVGMLLNAPKTAFVKQEKKLRKRRERKRRTTH